MKENMKNMGCRLLLFWVLCCMIPIGAFAQGITVQGIVMDSSGEPIIGATVSEKSQKTNAVITDLDGNFTLSLSKAGKIVVSFVGMQTKEVDAVVGRAMKITLEDDSQVLDEVEVVAVGYGNARRRDLTGAISSVGEGTLKNIPVTSASSARISAASPHFSRRVLWPVTCLRFSWIWKRRKL